MKKIESNSLSESFGLTEINSDEIFSVNGGSTINLGLKIGTCRNLGPLIPPLSGIIAGPTLPTLPKLLIK